MHNDLPLDFARAVVKAQRLTPSIKDQKAALEQGDEFSSFMVRVCAWPACTPASASSAPDLRSGLLGPQPQLHSD